MLLRFSKNGKSVESIIIKDLRPGQSGCSELFELRYNHEGRLFIANDTPLTAKRPRGGASWVYVEKTKDSTLIVNVHNMHLSNVRRQGVNNLFSLIDILLVNNVLYGHFEHGQYRSTISDIRSCSTLSSRVSFWISTPLQRLQAQLRKVEVDSQTPVFVYHGWESTLPPEPRKHYEVRNRNGQLEIKAPLNPDKPMKRSWVKVVLAN